MDYRKSEIYKILFSLYCIFCFILIFFMNVNYGYDIVISYPQGLGDVVEEQIMGQVSLRELLFSDDTLVLDLTTKEIRSFLPVSMTLIWISISLIIISLVLVIIDVLKNKKYLTFIASISIFLAFFLFLIIPAFTHRDANGMGEARYLIFQTVPILIGLLSSCIVVFIKGRNCLTKG